VSHVVESGASRARRARRRRALITLAIVALMLFFAFWYAYSYYRASEQQTATPRTPSCAPTTPLAPAQVKVNVYNATSRSGLAARTAAEVRKRGFRVATVANDPLDKDVTATAEVRYGRRGTASSVLVITLVKGAKAVPDQRTDSSVDLVLGDTFTALVPAPKASAATATPTTPATC
jgi:LytR cell envelope-related transcriptional attenuator